MDTTKRYPAIGLIGSDHTSALYGVENGIVDWQGMGIQHFFYKNYEQDLIHSATTYIQHENNVIELGNRRIDGQHHPVHQRPVSTSVEEGFLYETMFESQEVDGLVWQERIFATEDDKVVFETTFRNRCDQAVAFETGGYVILRNPNNGKIVQNEGICWENNRQHLHIAMDGESDDQAYIESPTGFVFRTQQQMLKRKAGDGAKAESPNMIGVTTRKKLTIGPGENQTVRWGIGSSELGQTVHWDWEDHLSDAHTYWKNWFADKDLFSLSLSREVERHAKANLVAIKASLLDGFVPADITGHYFSIGSPCYYARDAMMITRAFLLAGFTEEAKEILMYLNERRTRNDSGEFFQRYNAKGEPSEGANNNVFHQFDSQGYFLRNVYTYYEKTGEWLMPFEEVQKYADVLQHFQGREGLIGPEGGVNEGVFGPAYITSSNMFIYGGLMAAIEMARLHDRQDKAADWERLAISIKQGIESTWIPEKGRFGYGYVDYIEEVIEKYDTPQFFGPLYGYPTDDRVRKMNETLTEQASFFGKGIGYSEQEYHHGPWLFNTGACAQLHSLFKETDKYEQIIDWMIDHSNGYGLMPEAIDGNDESLPFINPLTWACAEFVSSIAIRCQSNVN
ncbi:hypothetical protein [Alkalihalobacillus sp. AL-G]|uniref:hypothetical protein n=1 Tax=Alkalihalobacillus sp. AL-G TaxID=2926399 RepID=UPI00272D0362|nr:hypothetical protein [Alkalihalobacillus sp. AL-G]WLD92598.1 hypothetical protein MOJ78_16500 [Alkalihalobacillus sp. AL-G]